MNKRKDTWEYEVKKTLAKTLSLYYTHRIELCVGLILVLLAAVPILLYHSDIANIYQMMASEEVAAYTTAIYVSVMLLFKLVNDVRRDKSHNNMIVYRDNRRGIDASVNEFAGHQLQQTGRDLLAVKAYDSRTRMVRYFGVWVSYMFVSLSYNYVRSAVGG